MKPTTASAPVVVKTNQKITENGTVHATTLFVARSENGDIMHVDENLVKVVKNVYVGLGYYEQMPEVDAVEVAEYQLVSIKPYTVGIKEAN